MPNKPLTVSIVIPVYNEEYHLPACLDAIAQQTVRPLEVIVVDNNSTDNTAAIARSYRFVTLLREQRQGVVYARDRGFNAAKGTVIGRIDADSILAADWVAQLQTVFNDKAVAAVSGMVTYRDIGWPRAFDTVDGWIRRFLAKRTSASKELFLYGVNMAIRRRDWQLVKSSVCHARHLHEDLDLAVHMAKNRQLVAFSSNLRASISPRQAAARPREFYRYVWSGPRVYAEHGMTTQRYMYPIALFVLALYVPIRVLQRGYDPDRGQFSLHRAFLVSEPARVSPVSESL